MSPALALTASLVLFGGSWRPPELRVATERVADFEALREIALSYLGRPYVMGGIGNPGFDCSGLTCRVFAEAGYALPRVSRDQAHAGIEVPLSELQPGDLLFFVGEPGTRRITHVGLYLGGGEMVHASTGQGQVVISELDRRWYRDRLAGARRVLPRSGTSSTAPGWSPPAEIASRELDEHDGEDSLPPMLRLPPRLPDPSLGPQLGGFGATAFALRAAGVTENGRLGLVLSPEATLRFEELALELTFAAPIRFEPGASPTAGELDDVIEWTRFLRSAAFGLRGADLELRLSRLGDVSLAGGLLVDHLQPAAASSGVPGLSVVRSPLTFFGGYRDRSIEVDAVIDDIVAPGVTALGVRLPLLPGVLRAGVAVATDQRAITGDGGRRAINAAEAAVFFDAVDTQEWTVSASGLGGLARAGGDSGFGAALAVDAELRLARGGTRAIAARLVAAHLGPRFLDTLFGPTYFASKDQHFDALGGDRSRASFGGELSLRLGKLVIGAGHHDAFGSGAQAFDRRTFALFELRDVRVGSTQLLDLRVAYAARGLLSAEREPEVNLLQGGLRLRITSWLFAEGYLASAATLEGGLGMVVGWVP